MTCRWELCYTYSVKKTYYIPLIIGPLLICSIGLVVYRAQHPKTQVIATSATYVCKGNKIIGAKFYQEVSLKPDSIQVGVRTAPKGSVYITLGDGRSMQLLQTVSASGARYATPSDSFVFWVKGKGSLVLENDKEEAFIDCEEGIHNAVVASTTQKYLYDSKYFSIILPRYTIPPALSRTDSFEVNDSYTYESSPSTVIQGTKFIIPKSFTEGNNLSRDTYISVEHSDNQKKCTASSFLERESPAKNVTEKGIIYSVASSVGAAAGNRYEGTIYATQKRNKCFAIRYFIHYTAIENYPKGTIKEFDMEKLINNFDAIRKTLEIHY